MIALYICLGIIGAALVFYVIPNMFVAAIVFNILLVRTNKKKWSRSCSWDDPEQERMFAEGEQWGKDNDAYHRRVSVKNGRLNLVGEYFDFGFSKTVIIVPGRMETCVYSYYFAEPYKKLGYNVLAIDNRSHGLSDGKFNTLGMREYKDLLIWAKFLHEQCHVQKIWFHGICIGGATALNAFTSENAPDYFEGLTVDGTYLHFGDMLERRIKARNRKAHPCTEFVMFYEFLVSGKNPAKHGPIHCIDKMNKPMLFLYSREDVFSPEDAVLKLYDKCPSSKRLVWFDKGIHSHLRINAPELYDRAIADFVSENAQ